MRNQPDCKRLTPALNVNAASTGQRVAAGRAQNPAKYADWTARSRWHTAPADTGRKQQRAGASCQHRQPAPEHERGTEYTVLIPTQPRRGPFPGRKSDSWTGMQVAAWNVTMECDLFPRLDCSCAAQSNALAGFSAPCVMQNRQGSPELRLLQSPLLLKLFCSAWSLL